MSSTFPLSLLRIFHSVSREVWLRVSVFVSLCFCICVCVCVWVCESKKVCVWLLGRITNTKNEALRDGATHIPHTTHWPRNRIRYSSHTHKQAQLTQKSSTTPTLIRLIVMSQNLDFNQWQPVKTVNQPFLNIFRYNFIEKTPFYENIAAQNAQKLWTNYQQSQHFYGIRKNLSALSFTMYSVHFLNTL